MGITWASLNRFLGLFFPLFLLYSYYYCYCYYFNLFIKLFLPQLTSFTFLLSIPPRGRSGASGCVVLTCWLGLNHDSLFGQVSSGFTNTVYLPLLLIAVKYFPLKGLVPKVLLAWNHHLEVKLKKEQFIYQLGKMEVKQERPLAHRKALALGRLVWEESPALLCVTAEWETRCACDIRVPLQSNKHIKELHHILQSRTTLSKSKLLPLWFDWCEQVLSSKICIANMSISIISSDCILERKTILPSPCPSSFSHVPSTLEKSYTWLKHMLSVGGKKVPSKSSHFLQQSSCIYPSSLKVWIRTEELLLQNLLPFDKSFPCVAAVIVSSSLFSLQEYLMLEGRHIFFSSKEEDTGCAGRAQLCLHSQFNSSDLTILI